MRKIFYIALIAFVSCNSSDKTTEPQEEIQTARAGGPPTKDCFTVCDTSKRPDLHIVTAADTSANSYFTNKYGTRAIPIEFTPNFLVTKYFTTYYGWDSAVYVNMARIQCLNENLSPYDTTCKNDWKFDTSQGKLIGNKYLFEGLFSFETYEKGNGNKWKLVYTDFKKEYNPVLNPAFPYWYSEFCYYDRGIPAQSGDFYRSYFRFPNHDGTYKLLIKFNPLVKNCRAVKETNYENNNATIELKIINGTVIILSTY